MSDAHIRALQTALAGLGFDPGPIDGTFGPRTATAAAMFATSEDGSNLAPEAEPVPEQPVRGGQARIALVVGHTSKAGGAVRATDGVNEFAWNSALAEDIQIYLNSAGHRCEIFFRDASLGYTSQIRKAYAAVDAWGAEAVCELHFNAAADARATGTETLTSGSARSLVIAKAVQGRMVAALGLRDRGLITRGRGDRGGESLVAGRAPAILIEPYFGSNAQDCAAADKNRAQLVAAIAEGLLA